jgi:hypothetical protein
MVGSVVSAQPTTMGEAAGPGYELVLGKAAVETSSDAVRLAVDFTAIAKAAAPVKLDLASLVRTTSRSWSIEGQNVLTLWNGQSEAPEVRKGDIDWVGLLSEQVRIDATMHFKRLTEPKTRHEITHSSHFGGYVTAVKSYFTTGGRWGDGDPFFNNNINHPIMGAVSSRVYTNNDRRCKAVGYGDSDYWSCVGRATVFSVLASFNWEWNPLMSESALGHVGKFHTCTNGKCTGEGGWSDFVMTPLGGMGIRIAGDFARAKFWPTLDRHLSGNIAARILKTTLKIVTDPSGMANAAFNADFRGAFSSRPAGRR